MLINTEPATGLTKLLGGELFVMAGRLYSLRGGKEEWQRRLRYLKSRRDWNKNTYSEKKYEEENK